LVLFFNFCLPDRNADHLISIFKQWKYNLKVPGFRGDARKVTLFLQNYSYQRFPGETIHEKSQYIESGLSCK